MADEKKGLGLNKNVSGALAYLLGPVTGVVFFLIEKDPFVKFHAKQSIVVFGGLFIIQWLLSMTIILIPVVPFVSILGMVLWILLMIKAYQGKEWQVPYVGKFVDKIFSKIK